VQVGEAQHCLSDQELRLPFIEAHWLLLQRFQQIPTSTQLEYAVMAILVFEMLFDFHDMLVPFHDIGKLEFA